MILPPSPDRAANTMEGLEYASDVTHVQWKAYLVVKKANKKVGVFVKV